MTDSLSRETLLRRGAALAASGAGLAVLAPAPAAGAVPDVDLSYLRLLVGAELLKADFASRALAAGKLRAPVAQVVRRIRSDDALHYRGLAALLNDAGQQPAAAGDIDFAYPARSFASNRSIATLGWTLGTLALGAYLGALENVQTPQARLPLGQIAANEAQQLSALAPFAGKASIGPAFAAALPIDAVSAALDRYES